MCIFTQSLLPSTQNSLLGKKKHLAVKEPLLAISVLLDSAELLPTLVSASMMARSSCKALLHNHPFVHDCRSHLANSVNLIP